MRKSVLFAVAALAGIGGSFAVAGDSKDKKQVEIKKIGEPINCVNLRNIRSTNVVDDRTIDFKMNGGKTYRNDLGSKCPSLGFEERFSYRTSLNQLCNVDIIRVLHNYGGRLQEGAGCGLGKFQQIEKVPVN